MSKIDINAAAEIIKRHDIEPATLRQIVEEMNRLVEPEGDENPTPQVKKQFSVIVSDPDRKLPKGLELVAWVCQIPESESVTGTADRIHKAAYEFNTTKKGRMMPAKTMGDAIENIPAKLFKEHEVWIKTKAPVFVVTTDNQIPKEGE